MPDVTTMRSSVDVEKAYVPGVITPIVALPVAVSSDRLWTFPSK
jgi:hypothetical protein